MFEAPFQRVFMHSSATRACAHSLIVTLYDQDGTCGYGEGCPRVYVTNEECQNSFDYLSSIQNEILQIESLEKLKEYVETHRSQIDLTPAAWCAFELAFLDLLGKVNQLTVEQILGDAPIKDAFRYTAVLGIQELSSFSKSVMQYSKLGFDDFKLKVSGIVVDDAARVDILRNSFGQSSSKIRLRIDANNLWEDHKLANELISALSIKPWAIEEPLKNRSNFLSMQEIATENTTKIILDESLCNLETIELLPKEANCWIANVRISKCGGLMRSIELVEKLIESKIGLIIGAHVGETSILTRAAITLANRYRAVLLAQEGAFGSHLLSKDIVADPIMFSAAGRVTAHRAFEQPGLGLL